MKYIINGKAFFKKHITGQQRYILEILRELDKLLDNEKIQVELVVPENAYNIENYKNIKVTKYKKGNPVLWEQVHLYRYSKKNKATLINMSNTSPFFKPDILFILDVVCITNPQYFSFLKSLYYKIIFGRTIKHAKKIVTISEFSREEISENYKIPKDKIEIISPAWQHIKKVNEKEYKKTSKKYFFSLGTIDKHKNTKWVIEVAKKNPEYDFLISGFPNSQKVFQELKIESTSNVKYLGFVKDEEMINIIKNAEALIVPSYYEGFGIPPIEALALGGKVIISDIPVFKEVYEDTAYYINPNNPDVNLEKLLKQDVKDAEKVFNKYSWEKSAKQLLKILNEYTDFY